MESGDPSFPDLLERARGGDPTAYSGLWQRHATAVAVYVATRGAEDVDAVVSDAFLAAFGGIATFEGSESGFRALLLTVARRRLVDEARRRSRRVQITPWSRDRDLPGPPLEDVVLADELDPHLLAGLRALTSEQREVVLLRLVEELSIEEVAQVLDRSPGSVKALQRRAVDALRRHLAARPPTLLEER